MPPQLDELVAVPLDELDAFHESQCPDPVPCPDCISCTNGEIFAYCDMGSCRGAHLDDLGLRNCAGDDDCQLRWGTACYEPCGGTPDCGGLTAVSVDGLTTLVGLVCDPDAPPPPPCVPAYPSDAIALCNAGTCEVAYIN